MPLAGLRVLDIGVSVAIPFATMWLARMGAEVICLESRAHMAQRTWPPFADDDRGENRAGTFNLLHTGKLSCTLDVGSPRGRELAEALVSISDVLVENFSEGTMEKLGLGYDRLSRLRPDLVMLSLSAFGRTGPMRGYVGYHSAVLLYSGLAAITGYSGGHPRILGSVFPDPISGTYGVLGILQALYRRAHTGAGTQIDLAMYEAMLTMMPIPVMEYALNGVNPARVGNQDPVKAPHGVYPCGEEGSWVAISVGSERDWEAFCTATDHSEWGSDPRFVDSDQRRANNHELDTLIASWTRCLAPYEVMDVLQKVGVASGPSLDAGGLLSDPHLTERGFIIETDHPEVGPRKAVGLP